MKKFIKSLFLVTTISLIVTGIFIARYVRASSSTINVTVPAKVDVVFNSDGSNTISKFNIVNNSLVPIKVVDVVLTPVNGWELISDTTTLTKDTRKLKLTMQNKIITSGVNSLGINITDGTEYTMPITVDRGTWTSTIKEQAFKLNFNYEIGKKEFQLSFNTNGGTPITTQTLFNGDVITLPNSSKRGYTLVSWIDNNGVSYVPGSRYTMPIGNSTLEAKWSINNYQLSVKAKVNSNLYTDLFAYVTFDTYIGSVRGNDDITSYSEYLQYDTIYDIRDIRTKPGIKYEGSSVLSMSGTIPDSNVTVELPFSENTYTIKYNLNGGSVTGNTISYKTSSNDISIPTPIKTGYSFAGWDESITPKDWYNGFIEYTLGEALYNPTYPNAVFSELIDVSAGTYSLSLEGIPNDQVRVRQYKADGSYVGNIVGNSYATFQLQEDGYVRILLLDNDETTKSTIKLTRDLDTPVIHKGSAGNREYVANWTANSYTVNYYGNSNASGTTSPSTHYYDSPKALTKNAFNFAGHSFNGWNSSSYGVGQSYTDSEVVKNLSSKNGDIINLYAQWAPNEYSLIVNPNNGETSKVYKGVTGEVVNLETPSRLGFNFASWKVKDTSTGAVGKSQRYYNFSGGTAQSVRVYKYGSSDSDLYGNLEVVPASEDNPTTSAYEAKITATKGFLKDGVYTYVGFASGSSTASNNSYYHTFTAKIPKGVKLGIAYNSRGIGAKGPTWITSNYGTGEWETYSYKTELGADASNGALGYVYVESIDSSVPVPFSWYLAETEIIDVTSGNPDGIYSVIGSKNNVVEAQWRPIEYNINYNLAGGTLTSSLPSSYTIISDAITLGNPSKTGHSFMGWTECIRPTVWTKGDLYVVDGAPMVSQRGAYYTDAIYVKAGQHYKWNNGEGYIGARYYDLDGNYIRCISEDNKDFIPGKDGYIRFVHVEHEANLDRADSVYLESINPIKSPTISKGSTGDREYIANWQPISYYIDVNGIVDSTYVNNALPINFDIYINGSPVYTSVHDFYAKYPYGSTYEIKNVVAHTGYTYNGITSDSAPLKGTLTDTTKIKFSITTNTYTSQVGHVALGFNGEPGTNNTYPSELPLHNTILSNKYNEQFTLTQYLKIPNGYRFDQYGMRDVNDKWLWYTDINHSFAQIPKFAYGGIYYRPIDYKINYNLEGGTNNSSNPATYNVLYGVTLKAPTKTGYTFEGWYLDGVKVTGINEGATAVFTSPTDFYDKVAKRKTGDVTLTAKWKENVLTVNYYSNYGDTYVGTPLNPVGADKNVIVKTVKYLATDVQTYGLLNVATNGNIPLSRTGYTSTAKYGTTPTGGKLVHQDTGFNTSMDMAKALGTSIDSSDATINIYPQWTPNNYTISYNLDGGTVSGNPTSYNVETPTITLKNPTKPGFTFKGWTGSNGTSVQTSVTIAKGSTGNKSYTANWALATNTKVTIRHNLMSADYTSNYTLKETTTSTGTTNATITTANYKKTYTGFTYTHSKVGESTVTSTTILADGSRVIDLYYRREKAYIVSGPQVNNVLQSMSVENKLIVTLDAIPANKISSAKIISTSDSPVKVYVYKEGSGSQSITYICPEADGISIITGSDCSSMFSGISNATFIDASKLDTSNATNMNNMFSDNYSATEIRLNGPNFNTSKVTTMTSMFINNGALVNLEHNIDTSSAVDLSYMFYSCYSINSRLILRNPNTIMTSYMISETATNPSSVFDLYYLPETESLANSIYRACVSSGNVNLKLYK